MLALDPAVVGAVWASFSGYLPEQGVCTHPLGCHRPRTADRDRFEAILFRLVTGCSWDVAGRLGKGSETTLRRQGVEWMAAGVFARLARTRLAERQLDDVVIAKKRQRGSLGGIKRRRWVYAGPSKGPTRG